MNRIDKATVLLKHALDAINFEINNPNVPETGPASRPQLIEFKRRLEKTLILIKERGASISREEIIKYSVGHIIMDSWPYDMQLGSSILAAENELRKALR